MDTKKEKTQCKEVDYADVIALGFNESEQDDPVYFNQYGYPYKIITFNLTKKLFIDWDQVTRLCKLVRTDKKGENVKASRFMKDLNEVKETIEFYTKPKKSKYDYTNYG